MSTTHPGREGRTDDERANRPLISRSQHIAIAIAISISPIFVYVLTFHLPNQLSSSEKARTMTTLHFPDDFMWGTATAAYQIEGAATEDRQPSIWDRFSSTPGNVINNDTGEAACDHYHRYESDVNDLIKPLNTEYYRFSIAWPRIQTWKEGDKEPSENSVGIQFYSKLIDALIEKGITPVVTLYHWDLPTAVHDRFDGWAGRKSISDAFATYAEICFRHFGDRVKWWITLNEPWCSAYLGYENGEHAPGDTSARGKHVYKAGHNLLLAHAKAVAKYRQNFQSTQNGRIGITLNAAWYEPADRQNEAHVRSAARGMHFELGWFAHPVYKGDYPDVMRGTVGERLPVFTEEERGLLKGSSDFFGLNHYTTVKTKGLRETNGTICYDNDKATDEFQDEGWKRSDMGWPIVAEGFTSLVEYIQTQYSPPGGIIVTENGVAVRERTLEEARGNNDRVGFYKAYLSALHSAMNGAVKADVRGYFLWSLMDNFEWAFGYGKRFGLYYVDYDSLKRSAKPAVQWYAQVVKNNALTL